MPVTTRSSPGPDLHQARSAQGSQRDRVRAGRVGLAAVAGGGHPHLRGQLRRHTGHDLAVMDQAVRQVPADAVAALHRPDPVRERPRRGQHFRIPGLVRAVPARRQHYCPLIDDLDRGRALMRVHPDDHAHDSSSPSPVISGEEGTATSSWANPFRASPRTVPGEKQAMSEPRQ
jgi:hypothetical protein